MLRRFGLVLAALAGLGALAFLAVRPALAQLKVGAAAPTFAAKASLGGKVFDFDLAKALAKGPVVLYFYPAAFTKGCTLEAHDFAAHIDEYHKLGATVIGVSEDDIAKLNKFSVSECRSKFAVAADSDAKIAKAYGALLTTVPRAFANRTSYVIARDGKIVYAYTSLDPGKHVANTLNALKALPKPATS
ncbi:MAG: peroxiredoxin [Candidatus Baltobacteraceae bacterium]|jgi:peroxiredoxin